MKATAVSGLKFIKGAPYDFSQLGKGKPVVLEFWATWCPPCRQSIPHLTELAHKYNKIHFIGITDEQESTAARFVQQMGSKMDYPVAIDTDQSAQAQYMARFGMQGIPSAFVIDGSGTIVYKGHPMEPQFETVLQRVNTEAASTPPPKPQVNREGLNAMSVKELKSLMQAHHISSVGCLEKTDLVDKILSAL